MARKGRWRSPWDLASLLSRGRGRGGGGGRREERDLKRANEPPDEGRTDHTQTAVQSYVDVQSYVAVLAYCSSKRYCTDWLVGWYDANSLVRIPVRASRGTDPTAVSRARTTS
jgi:hypothetical protein